MEVLVLLPSETTFLTCVGASVIEIITDTVQLLPTSDLVPRYIRPYAAPLRLSRKACSSSI